MVFEGKINIIVEEMDNGNGERKWFVARGEFDNLHMIIAYATHA